MKRFLPVALVALIFSLFLASTPEAQVRIVRGFRAAITFVVNSLGTTATPGVTLSNDTAATAAVTVQRSPALEFDGAAWNSGGGASETNKWRVDVLPVTVAGATYGRLLFNVADAGGAFGTEYALEVLAQNVTLSGRNWVQIAGQSLQLGNGGSLYLNNGRGDFTAPADGILTYRNGAASAGVRLQYSGVPSITTVGITGDGFGGGASILTGSTDTFGFIRVGAGTEGIIAFATDWGTNLQQGCTANNEDGTPTYVQVTDKTMRLAGGTRAVPVAWTSASVVNWICGGAK